MSNHINRREAVGTLLKGSLAATLVTFTGSVPDVDIGGFNVLRIRGITNHRI